MTWFMQSACARNITGFSGLLVLLTAGSLAAASSRQDKPSAEGGQDLVEFRFAPPDGTKFTVTRSVTATFVLEDGAEPQDLPAGEPTQTNFVYRQTQDGYELILKPDRRRTTRRMLDTVDNISAALMTTSDITVRYDENGRLLAIFGLERAANNLRSLMPKQGLPALDKLLPMALKNFEDKWKGRFEPFVGHSFPVGEFASSTIPLPLPNGKSIDVIGEIGVPERADFEGRDCVVVMVGYKTIDEGIGGSLGELMYDLLKSTIEAIDSPGVPAAIRQKVPDALKRLRSEFPQILVKQYSTAEFRLVDPDTMLCFREAEVRAFELQMTFADGEVVNVIASQQTTSEYRYTNE